MNKFTDIDWDRIQRMRFANADAEIAPNDRYSRANLKEKITSRMDQLQAWMERNYHLKHSDKVYEHTLTISKFWSVLSEEDREYVQMAQMACEEKQEWNV